MKNTTLVTISTLNRSWVLPVGKATRMFLTFCSIFVVVAISVGIVIIYQFNNRIDLLEVRKYELQDNIISLNSSAELLQQKIQSQEFTLVKLQELEELAGTELEGISDDSFVFSDDSVELSKERQNNIRQRISNARASLTERKWLLQTIPSGSPLGIKTYVTSKFGTRKHPVTKRKQMHYGVDYFTRIGDDVIATADGIVEFAAYNTGGYGHMIRIRHSHGFTTVYAHLNKRLVRIGEVVVKGQVIGKSGNSGISTGPHLHYEIHFIKKKLNPHRFVGWSLDNYEDLFSKEKNVRWVMVVDHVRRTLQKLQNESDIRPTSMTIKNN